MSSSSCVVTEENEIVSPVTSAELNGAISIEMKSKQDIIAKILLIVPLRFESYMTFTARISVSMCPKKTNFTLS